MDYNFWAAYIAGGLFLMVFTGFVMITVLKNKSCEASQGVGALIVTAVGFIYAAGIFCFSLFQLIPR